MKFAADRMLGRLAKWLRFIGYNTLYFNEVADEEFILLANEGRILLSRNTRLAGRVSPDHYLFVKHNDPKAQLKHVIWELDLKPDPENFFTRCSLCNGTLEYLNRNAVYGKVPDYVWTVNNIFSRCKECGKIYWPGTHVTSCREYLNSLFER